MDQLKRRKAENDLEDFCLDTQGEKLPCKIQDEIDVSSATEEGFMPVALSGAVCGRSARTVLRRVWPEQSGHSTHHSIEKSVLSLESFRSPKNQ